MANESKLPIPAALEQYSETQYVSDYFKQMHIKIQEINNRVSALEEKP